MFKNHIGIIVLAAGASQRMGAPKQLIKIDGTSLVRRAAQVALASGCGPVVIVLGANAPFIEQELEGLGITLAIADEWETGMSASIRAGLSALLAVAPQTEGVLLTLADQPNITSETLDKLLLAQARDGAELVAAQFHDVVGTPAFFSRKYFDELLHLDGNGGAKILLQRHHARVLPVDLPEAEQDLDTPEDMAAYERKKIEATRKSNLRPGNPDLEIFPDDPTELETAGRGQTRRQFLTNVTAVGVGVAAAPLFINPVSAAEPAAPKRMIHEIQKVPVKLRVNGLEQTLQLDPRVTLLDALRERLGLTGSKKGCDHGQCGACTVLVNGRRINSCLALAVVHDGDEITTIEGLANGQELHPVQAAFLENDGFQCGYCTPGQICSAVALLKEGHANDDAEIREWMSGNICRCGAYTNIVAAIQSAKAKTGGAR